MDQDAPALASQMSWLGLGLIAVAACCFGSSTVYPGLAVVLPVTGAALVVAGGCPGWSRGAELILMRRPAQFLGRVSYSWYLVHWPMLIVLPMATGHPLTLAGKLFVLFGSLALAVALFYLVERPIRASSLLVRKPRYGLALGGVLVAASIGSTIAVSDLVVIPGAPGPAVAAASGLRVVDNALAAAVKLTRLPAHLTPSLSAAPGDISFTTRACLAGEDVTAPPPTARCTFGDLQARRTIVVVGDSHANAWSPAFDAFATTYHWRFVLFAKAACPPGVYPTYVSPLNNQIYTECNQWRNNMFARLKEMRPSVILVTSEIRVNEVDPAGMVQSIREFESTGARVIYMEDTPEPLKLGSVPDGRQHPTDIQQCALYRDNPGSRLDAFAPRRLEAEAVQGAGAIVIDPSVWFCTATTCPPVINNIVVDPTKRIRPRPILSGCRRCSAPPWRRQSAHRRGGAGTMDAGSGRKLTRRGFLVLVPSGAAGLAYLESQRHPGPATPAAQNPQAVMAVPVVGTFVPVFVKPSQVLNLVPWRLNLPTGRTSR